VPDVLVDGPYTVAEPAAATDSDVDVLYSVLRCAFTSSFFAQLHNSNDEKAELILRRIREAIGDNTKARLLIVDMLLADYGQWDIGKLADVEMLGTLGGTERCRDEWNSLLGTAGFEPANVSSQSTSP
jgi:hypothetical protein